jgi:hypothetical protein
MISEDAELIRKRYKYRRLILSGKLILPVREASMLLGPDCAYHRYSVQDRIRSGTGKPERSE